jgi:hypothetical protein
MYSVKKKEGKEGEISGFISRQQLYYETDASSCLCYQPTGICTLNLLPPNPFIIMPLKGLFL